MDAFVYYCHHENLHTNVKLCFKNICRCKSNYYFYLFYSLRYLTLFIIFKKLDQNYVVSVIKDVIEVSEKCAQEVQATPEDMFEIRLYKLPPSTHEGKCVLACFYKSYHLMRSDGTWDDKIIDAAFAPIKEMDADVYNKIVTVLKSCEHLREFIIF